MKDLRKLVRDKIEDLGVKESVKFFGVSAGTISNWSTGKTDPSLDAAMRCLMLEPPPEDVEETDDPQIVMWQGKKVIMLLPVYRTFCADTHYSLFANYAKYGPDKIGMIMEKRTVIHEARNILTHKYRKTDAPFAIMCDDDMIPPCGNADLFNGRWGAKVHPRSAQLNAISRLMSHPEDKRIIGSTYYGRHDNGKLQASMGFATSTAGEAFRSGKQTGLVPDEWVAPGFMRIHRSVFDEMQTHIDAGRWPECKPPNEKVWYGFWNPMHVGMGEDVSFGRRAAEIGIKSYIDADLICLHVGERMYGPSNTKT